MRSLALVLCLAACGDDTVPNGAADGGPPDAGRLDARTTCPSDAAPRCDYFLACGCPDGDKCAVGGTGPECFTPGIKTAGEDCTGEMDCVARTGCLPYEGRQQCMTFCDDFHACPDGQACYVSVTDGLDPPTVYAKTCAPICSLLLQDCGFAGKGCYPSVASVPLPERGLCATAGTGLQGATCAKANDCAGGYTCLSSTRTCVKLCDRTDGAPGCEPGLTCNPLAGHSDTGYCLAR